MYVSAGQVKTPGVSGESPQDLYTQPVKTKKAQPVGAGDIYASVNKAAKTSEYENIVLLPWGVLFIIFLTRLIFILCHK